MAGIELRADTVIGTNGTNGADATSTTFGTNGTDGEDVYAGSSISSPDAVAVGGNGGNGGAGFYGNDGGSGGQGGSADANGLENASATGGQGGDAGLGGTGGDGGAAQSGVYNSSSYYSYGTISSTGGRGGGGGIIGGQGGTAIAGGNVQLAPGYDSSLSLSYSVIGGDGGDGATTEGSAGSGGAASIPSDDTITGVTYHGDLSVSIYVRGGNGGDEDNDGKAGSGGNASSEGMNTEYSHAQATHSINYWQQVVGGNAGDTGGEDGGSSYGTAGLAGTAYSHLYGVTNNEEHDITVTSIASGGKGGSAATNAQPGGYAESDASASGETAGTVSMCSSTATGGAGGYAEGYFTGEYGDIFTSSGSSAAGGSALANAYSKGETADATATATGGDGGLSYIDEAGIGGAATANATAISSISAHAKAVAISGHGGLNYAREPSSSYYAGAGTVSATAVAECDGIYGEASDVIYSGGGTITAEAWAAAFVSSGTISADKFEINHEDEGSALPASIVGPMQIRPMDDPGSTATLTQSGGSVIATESVTINDGGTYLISGGNLLTPSLVNNGSFNVSGGTIDASVTNNTTATMSGGTIDSGYTLTNAGTFNLSGGTVDSSIVNDGTFKIGASTDVSTSSPPAGQTFTNDSTGDVAKLTSGTSHFYLPSTWNGGTITVGSGTLDIVGDATLTSGSTLHTVAFGSLVIDGTLSTTGAATLAAASYSGLRLNGALNSNLIVTTNGSAAVTFGSDQTIGTTHLSSGSTVNVAPGHTLTVGTFSDSSINLNGGTLAVTGTYSSNFSDGFYMGGSGTIVFSGPHSYSAGSFNGNIEVDGGAVRLNSDTGTTTLASSPSIYVGKFGSLYVGSKQHLNDLYMDNGGIVAADSGGKPIFAATVEIGDALGSTIDLNDGGMAAGSITDPVFGDSVHDMIADGTVMSSAATTDTTLGYATASEVGRSEFYGDSVDSTTTLIMYTYAGDANLDGSVTEADKDIVEADMGMTGADWAEGDFNYDGTVDSTDLAIVEANLGDSGLGDGDGADLPNAAVTPEPAIIGALFFPAIFANCLRRRRRA